MNVLLNGLEVVIPSSLAEFTLGQRISFYIQYGRDLDEQLADIIKMPESIDKELKIMDFHYEKMIKTFSFFANVTPEAIEESNFLDDIASIYKASLTALFEEEENIDFQLQHRFKDELWEIHPPELKHGSKLSFGEFIDSKQIVKDMMELGNGRWEMMQKLCAIFFRKTGEAYEESFVYEDSDRMKLMLELPMNIVLSVGFFLTSSMNMYIKTFRSSANQELKEVPESSAKSILNTGVGSTF